MKVKTYIASQDLVLDAGALIAIERGNERVRALLSRSLRSGVGILIPAGVLAHVWRDARRQITLARLLAEPSVRVVPLDENAARTAGVLCRRARTRDVVDASVVVCGGTYGGALIVTSDAAELARLDANARLIAI